MKRQITDSISENLTDSYLESGVFYKCLKKKNEPSLIKIESFSQGKLRKNCIELRPTVIVIK